MLVSSGEYPLTGVEAIAGHIDIIAYQIEKIRSGEHHTPIQRFVFKKFLGKGHVEDPHAGEAFQIGPKGPKALLEGRVIRRAPLQETSHHIARQNAQGCLPAVPGPA